MPPVPDVGIEQLRCTAPDGRVMLDLPSLCIQRGERVAVIGPNGAGKSTLLRCLSGFAQPVAGQLQVLQQDLLAAPSRAAWRALRTDVAQVHQGLHLVQRLSALDNVLIGALGRTAGWRSWLRWPQTSDEAQALRALDSVGMLGHAATRADRLSGGEQQKVCIARMVMQRPRLILADEPTANLDPTAARDACQLLRHSAAAATLLVVVHNPDLLPLLADRVLGLKAGRLLLDLPLGALNAAHLKALYEEPDVSNLSHSSRAIDPGRRLPMHGVGPTLLGAFTRALP
jgi:phosphonate transport system ATP-binding protein